MRVALDTNVLVYAEGLNAIDKRDIALGLVQNLPQTTTFIPVQVLGELFNVLIRKAGWDRTDARNSILTWRDAFPVIHTTSEAMVTAADLAKDHKLSIWDAVIVSVSAQSGCRLLLSEDMQDGFTWCGVTVVNPFNSKSHSTLRHFLK